MKIFDCFMFYDEELMLDVRLNILNEYVDYFVIVESKFLHNGQKRELNFDINKYKKFKHKIIYLIQKNPPKGILELKENDSEGTKSYKLIFNSHLRENSQRNHISNGLYFADDNDIILISDVDEIPKLDNINLKEIKNKILMFEQKIFYYKFNRYLKNFIWYGTKACKKKYLKNPQWLRNLKNKKYLFYRIDTYFSDKKYIDKYYIKDGGWHFSNIKNARDIEFKLKSYLHHRDYEVEELGYKKIENIMKNNETIYDMFGDKTSKKYGDERRKKLEKYELNNLPKYIINNKEKFKDWLD